MSATKGWTHLPGWQTFSLRCSINTYVFWGLARILLLICMCTALKCLAFSGTCAVSFRSANQIMLIENIAFSTCVLSYLDFYLEGEKRKVLQGLLFHFCIPSKTPSELLSKEEEIQTIVSWWQQQQQLTISSLSFLLFHWHVSPWECLGKPGVYCFCKPPVVSDRNMARLLWYSYVIRNCWKHERRRLVLAMRNRRKRCILCKQSQKDLVNNCWNQLGKLMECNSSGVFLAEVVFIGWI